MKTMLLLLLLTRLYFFEPRISCIYKTHRNFLKYPVWSHFYFAEEDEDEQKEVAKLLKEVNDEISVENRKKEGRKDTSLEAAPVKELTNQPQEGKVD